MGDFGTSIDRIVRKKPLPWYRKAWIHVRVTLALIYLRLRGVPKVPPAVFEASAERYRGKGGLGISE